MVTKKFLVLILKALSILAILFLVGLVFYWAMFPLRAPYWTGFNGSQPAINGSSPPKNLWDWLSLLIVPTFIAISVWWLNQSEKRNEREATQRREELDRAISLSQIQHSVLQSFIERISVLIDQGLLNKDCPKEKRVIARAWTISSLDALAPAGRARLVRFLFEAGITRCGESVFHMTGANISEASFASINLSQIAINRANLNGCDITGSILEEADFGGSTFIDAKGDGVVMTGAKLENTKFMGASLIGADMNAVTLLDADLSGANLSNSYFNHAILRSAKLIRSVAKGAQFCGANLDWADLTDADLSGADLTGASLSYSNLTNTNLSDAKLKCVNLKFCDLTKAKGMIEDNKDPLS